MAYHDELMKHALELVRKSPTAQADLRRGVSAAYYALFHLLISELVGFWNHADSKAALARMPQHRAMVDASKKIQQLPFPAEDANLVQKLREVGQAFVQLNEKREIADYDNNTYWAPTQALSEVALAARTISTWSSIRNERIAQGFVASLLVKPPRG